MKYNENKGKNVYLGAENQLQKYKMENSLTKDSTVEINLRLIIESNRYISCQHDSAAKKLIVALKYVKRSITFKVLQLSYSQ